MKYIFNRKCIIHTWKYFEIFWISQIKGFTWCYSSWYHIWIIFKLERSIVCILITITIDAISWAPFAIFILQSDNQNNGEDDDKKGENNTRQNSKKRCELQRHRRFWNTKENIISSFSVTTRIFKLDNLLDI